MDRIKSKLIEKKYIVSIIVVGLFFPLYYFAYSKFGSQANIVLLIPILFISYWHNALIGGLFGFSTSLLVTITRLLNNDPDVLIPNAVFTAFLIGFAGYILGTFWGQRRNLEISERQLSKRVNKQTKKLSSLVDNLQKANEDQKRKLLESQILLEISVVSNQTYDEDQLIKLVTEILYKNLYKDHIGILLLDDKKQILKIHSSYHGLSKESRDRIFEIGEGVVGRVLETKTSMRVPDVSKTPFYIPGSNIEARSELCVPILINNQAIGVFNAESNELDNFAEDDERFLLTVAIQLGIGIERLRLFNDERKLRLEAEIQQEVSQALTISSSLHDVLNDILVSMQHYLGFDSGGVFLMEDEQLSIMASIGFSEEKTKEFEKSTYPTDSKLFQEILRTKAPLILHNAMEDERFENYGLFDHIRGWMGVPMIDEGEVIGYITFDSSIPGKFTEENSKLAQLLVNQAATATTKAKLFDQTKTHLDRLKALHDIDQIISSSFDIYSSIGEYLKVVQEKLSVDAVSVLLLDTDSNTLNLVNSIGFKTRALQYTRLLVGDGYAGRAAQDRKPIFIPHISRDDKFFSRSKQLHSENFKSYYGVPLMFRGEVKGVLEVFHRSPLIFNSEWENFLNSIASQAAIAIENALLFEETQKANIEMSLAYDATLEGWAKTLELRDQETEGHSQRVVEMTVKLTKAMGLSFSEVIHARRGALLHDIGKIGIPDSILLKPGKLTEEEWVVMRQHPVFAYNSLSGISFLEPALDIPHYHHEKWDGTGYPKGLKGEEIPITARIFAIIDVYEALNSDRPYRKAWSKKKTLNHIQDQSGKHFDPDVVEAFLEIVGEK